MCEVELNLGCSIYQQILSSAFYSKILKNRAETTLDICQTLIYVDKQREVYVIGLVIEKNHPGFSKLHLQLFEIRAQSWSQKQEKTKDFCKNKSSCYINRGIYVAPPPI